MSFIDTVCSRIVENPRFGADYTAMLRESVLTSTGLPQGRELEEELVRRLTQSAALFAQSRNLAWHELAYRITVGALEYQGELQGVRDAARLILTRLGNYPAVQYAFGDSAESSKVPKSVFFELVTRKAGNTVVIGKESATLTDMQKVIWERLADGESVALSAPTSAGKSFVFLSYIRQVKADRPGDGIVFLVPTRALISQVSADLRRAIPSKDVRIVTVPLLAEPSPVAAPIYVLTPERLQVILQSAEGLKFDIVVVDEAHLIGDGSRGIILHSVLQDVERRNPKAQFLFSSPQVRDPAVFGSIIGNSGIQVVKSKSSPVAQNIVFLRGDVLDPRRMEISLWKDGQETSLTEISTSIPVYNSVDRLVYASWVLGSGAQSLVYAEGPATCEDLAIRLKELRSDPELGGIEDSDAVSESVQRARKELSEFAKEAVHSSYVLADTVLAGVGFHYGRIPALLRGAIEEAFSGGALSYIVSTSTLLQGVNMPARNMFMYNPQKGINTPIDAVSFWNLAGRAGRLGKDFQGNVFLVDYEAWESSPLAGPKDEPITPSLEQALTDEWSELSEYLLETDRPAGEKPVLEAAFSKLLRDYRHGHLDETLGRVSSLSPRAAAELVETLSRVSSAIKLDTATLDESPQISAYRQSELYEYMIRKIREEGPDYLIPVHPSASFTDALNRLRPVFARVHKYLELKSGNHHRYWAPLALRWMRGEALPVIIEQAIRYHKSQGKSRSNRTVIREVLSDVESDLRFRYVNLIGCYVSVLKQALRDSGFAEHVAKIPTLTLYLELGAASRTMIELMGLGLSRQLAGLIADRSINKDMDRAAAISLIRRFNPEVEGLSPYLTGEVRRVVAQL